MNSQTIRPSGNRLNNIKLAALGRLSPRLRAAPVFSAYSKTKVLWKYDSSGAFIKWSLASCLVYLSQPINAMDSRQNSMILIRGCMGGILGKGRE